MNDRELDDVLRSLRDEPLDEALAAAARAATLARIRRERRRPWLVLAGAIAAAVVLAVGLSGVRKPVETAVEPPAARPVEVTAAKPEPVKAAATQRRAATVRRRQARRPPLASEPMKIQMLTDDPDLVIIWLVGDEPKGESE